MSRRLAITPTQLQRFLEVLTPLGFITSRIELSPLGTVIIHAQGAEAPAEPDLLAEWEAKRASPTH